MGHELAVEVVEAGRRRPDAGRGLRGQSLSVVRSVASPAAAASPTAACGSPCSASIGRRHDRAAALPAPTSWRAGPHGGSMRRRRVPRHRRARRSPRGGHRARRALVVGAGPIGLGVALFAGSPGPRSSLFDRDAGGRRKSSPSIAARGRPPGGGSAPAGPPARASMSSSTPPATPARWQRGFDFVGHGGRYVLVSVVNEPITFRDPDFHRKEMTLLGEPQRHPRGLRSRPGGDARRRGRHRAADHPPDAPGRRRRGHTALGDRQVRPDQGCHRGREMSSGVFQRAETDLGRRRPSPLLFREDVGGRHREPGFQRRACGAVSAGESTCSRRQRRFTRLRGAFAAAEAGYWRASGSAASYNPVSRCCGRRREPRPSQAPGWDGSSGRPPIRSAAHGC